MLVNGLGAGNLLPVRLRPGTPGWLRRLCSSSTSSRLPGAHAPVHGECDQFAAATCAGYMVFHVFGCHVQPVAHGLVRPHAATQVNVREHIAIVRFQLHGSQCLFCWPLDDMIDQTTRRAGARLDATGALEQLM